MNVTYTFLVYFSIQEMICKEMIYLKHVVGLFIPCTVIPGALDTALFRLRLLPPVSSGVVTSSGEKEFWSKRLIMALIWGRYAPKNFWPVIQKKGEN